MDELNPLKATPASLMGCRPHFLAATQRWVQGKPIHRWGKANCFVKALDGPPSSIWEIRVSEVAPQWRLIGAFAEKDTFVGIRVHNRTYLGDYKSKTWQEAMNATDAWWATHMSAHPRLTSVDKDDLVTEFST